MTVAGLLYGGDFVFGLFWINLVIIITWFFRTAVQPITPDKNNPDQFQNHVYTELQSSLKSRADAWVSFAKYFVLLTMEIFDGYWLFVYWWRWTNVFNPWRFSRNIWFPWFWKCLVPVLSAMIVMILTWVAFMFLTITLVCLYELWVWEPRQNKDAVQPLQYNKQKEKEISE